VSGVALAFFCESFIAARVQQLPPADNWLGQKKASATPDTVVPLALHVDYWNSLGWTDRFSQHRFTERQQSLTDRAGGHVIYTPEVFVSGRELRSWSQRSSFDGRVQTLDGRARSGRTSQLIWRHARKARLAASIVEAKFTSRLTTKDTLNAYVALYAKRSELTGARRREQRCHAAS